MVDTNWRAVILGIVTIWALAVIGAYVEQLAFLGTGVGALLGGLVTGYLANSGMKDGAWNGLLAGSIGAIAVLVLLAVLGLVVSIVALSLGGILATVGFGAAAFVLIALNSIPAIVGGAIGGLVKHGETAETGRPAA
ncbi:DUF5518 domain-containing protein [Haloarchaeobius sp. TZWSO28]|uniref:DUF5518 domain-containing protein n=1 Tax=unclassified Haloarchaeobius TaxID=2614452 RepID=UPI003EBC2367